MTYEEFQEKVKQALNYSWFPETINIEWELGGYSGGNCWGDEATYSSGEKEPKFDQLDLILQATYPNVTYLQFRHIESNICDFREYEDRGYYGNSMSYAKKTIDLNELYDYLETK